MPALVFIHGGQHRASCWQPTLRALSSASLDVPTLALDMPGRGTSPGDLASATLDDFIESTVAQINSAGLDEVVLVSHSAAGLHVPQTAARLGLDRVKHLVFIASLIPAAGQTGADVLPWPMNAALRRAGRKPRPVPPINKAVAAYYFCNGMTAAQRRFTLDSMTAESQRIATTPIDRTGFPGGIPMSWILTGNDRIVSPRRQLDFIATLGGVDAVIRLDTCHDAMISRPTELSSALLTCVTRPRQSPPGLR